MTALDQPMTVNPLAGSPIIPVVTINHIDDALPMAEALLEGGIEIIEVTLRTAAAFKAMECIAKNLPDIKVGAGTIISVEDLQKCRDHGASFGLSPGLSESVLKKASDCQWPFIPGVATASEMMRAEALGYLVQKFFPAEINGGAKALKAYAGPLQNIVFCPTGGVTPNNIQSYLKLDNVCSVGGTWLTPNELVKAKQWKAITDLCREGQILSQMKDVATC